MVTVMGFCVGNGGEWFILCCEFYFVGEKGILTLLLWSPTCLSLGI